MTQTDFIQVEGGTASVRFQVDVYGLEPILRAVHRLTDRAHVHVEQRDDQTVLVRLRAAASIENVVALAGELANEVLDQRLRARIAEESEPVRRLLIAQAFSGLNLIRPDLDGADATAP